MLKNRGYNFFSYFNILIAFLTSLISLIPMSLYIQRFNEIQSTSNNASEFNQLLQPGFDKTDSLASSITITIVLSILTLLVMYLWMRDLSLKTRVQLDNKSFKFTKIIAILVIAFIILQIVIFFICWLVPLWSNSYNVEKDAKNIAYLRVILYAAVGGGIAILNVLTITCTTIYANLRISYFVTLKEDGLNEHKDN